MSPSNTALNDHCPLPDARSEPTVDVCSSTSPEVVGSRPVGLVSEDAGDVHELNVNAVLTLASVTAMARKVLRRTRVQHLVETGEHWHTATVRNSTDRCLVEMTPKAE